MIATYKVVDGKTLSYKGVKGVGATPFSTDVSNTVLSENIIERITDSPAVVAAQNRYSDLQKSECRTLWVGFGASLLVTAAIHFSGLSAPQNIDWKAVIDTWFLAAAGVLVILAVVAIITRENDNIKSMPTRKISAESEVALKAYFDDFVRERATAEGDDASLIEVTQFKIKTQTNDKRLRNLEISLRGTLKNAGSVTAASIYLRFVPSYTNLYVYRYDITDSI